MTGAERSPIRREPPPFHEVAVTAVRDRTPRLRTIALAGPGLVGFAVDGPAASVRLLLRRDGILELPGWTGNEFRYADGARPPIRTLTPRRPDPDAGTLEVDVVLHPDVPGPLSAWAQQTEPGDTVALSGPGRGYAVDPTAARFLLGGDESALPAIEQLLEAIQPTAMVDVLIEVAHPDARLALPPHPGADVRWLDLPAGARAGDALAGAVAAHDLSGSPRIWVAGEAAAVQRIRTHLFDAAGVPRSAATVRGYWKHGRAVGG